MTSATQLAAALKPREADIQRTILAYLRRRRVLHWRNNTGAMKRGKGYVRFGERGLPDIFLVLPGTQGQLAAVEVKRKGERPTPEQNVMLMRFIKAGCVGAVVTDVRDVEILLDACGWDTLYRSTLTSGRASSRSCKLCGREG